MKLSYIDEIDQVHLEMFATLAEIELQEAPDFDEEQVIKDLDRFIYELTSDFAIEERIMRRELYFDIVNHIAFHSEFLSLVKKFRDVFNITPPMIFDGIKYIRRALMQHVDLEAELFKTRLSRKGRALRYGSDDSSR